MYVLTPSIGECNLVLLDHGLNKALLHLLHLSESRLVFAFSFGVVACVGFEPAPQKMAKVNVLQNRGPGVLVAFQ